MTPTDLLLDVIIPAEQLFPPELSSPSSRALLLAIAGQESNWSNRIQIPNGQAHGFWQCEIGGAVLSFCTDSRLRDHRWAIIRHYDIPLTAGPDTVWTAITYHDRFACCVARCALMLDAQPLPPATLEGEQEAWNTYTRVWRPGKPRREPWSTNWHTAVDTVNANTSGDALPSLASPQ